MEILVLLVELLVSMLEVVVLDVEYYYLMEHIMAEVVVALLVVD